MFLYFWLIHSKKFNLKKIDKSQFVGYFPKKNKLFYVTNFLVFFLQKMMFLKAIFWQKLAFFLKKKVFLAIYLYKMMFL